MNGLIQILQTQIGAENVNSVNAREFYAFLGLEKSQFARWAKKNILENDFALENVDYIGFDIDVEGQIFRDYALNVDFAYKIAMKSQGSKAEQIRNWFIQLKNNKKSSAFQIPQTLSEALFLASKQAEQIEHQKVALEQKSQTIKNVVHSGNTYTSSQVAKDMDNPISAKLLNTMLNESGVIFWQNGTWQLYSKYANHCLTEIKETKPDKGGKTYSNLRWTALGKSWIYKNWTEIKQRVNTETLNEWELRITSNLPKVPMPKIEDRNF